MDSIHSNQLSGFLNIGVHGADPNLRDSRDIEIVGDAVGGQFDLAFCGLHCLSAWFEALIKRLETG